MVQTGNAPAPAAADIGYEVIDGDGHTIFPSDEWWKPYLEQKYWEWAPKNVAGPGGRGVLMAEGRAYPTPMDLPGGATMSDARGGVGMGVGLMIPGAWRLPDPKDVTPEEARRLGGAEPADRLRAMDEDGIGVAYLYPSELLSLPYALHSSAFTAALLRANTAPMTRTGCGRWRCCRSRT